MAFGFVVQRGQQPTTMCMTISTKAAVFLALAAASSWCTVTDAMLVPSHLTSPLQSHRHHQRHTANDYISHVKSRAAAAPLYSHYGKFSKSRSEDDNLFRNRGGGGGDTNDGNRNRRRRDNDNVADERRPVEPFLGEQNQPPRPRTSPPFESGSFGARYDPSFHNNAGPEETQQQRSMSMGSRTSMGDKYDDLYEVVVMRETNNKQPQPQSPLSPTLRDRAIGRQQQSDQYPREEPQKLSQQQWLAHQDDYDQRRNNIRDTPSNMYSPFVDSRYDNSNEEEDYPGNGVQRQSRGRGGDRTERDFYGEFIPRERGEQLTGGSPIPGPAGPKTIRPGSSGFNVMDVTRRNLQRMQNLQTMDRTTRRDAVRQSSSAFGSMRDYPPPISPSSSSTERSVRGSPFNSSERMRDYAPPTRDSEKRMADMDRMMRDYPPPSGGSGGGGGGSRIPIRPPPMGVPMTPQQPIRLPPPPPGGRMGRNAYQSMPLQPPRVSLSELASWSEPPVEKDPRRMMMQNNNQGGSQGGGGGGVRSSSQVMGGGGRSSPPPNNMQQQERQMMDPRVNPMMSQQLQQQQRMMMDPRGGSQGARAQQGGRGPPPNMQQQQGQQMMDPRMNPMMYQQQQQQQRMMMDPRAMDNRSMGYSQSPMGQQQPSMGYQKPPGSIPLSELAIQPNIEPIDRVSSAGQQSSSIQPPNFDQVDPSEFRQPYRDNQSTASPRGRDAQQQRPGQQRSQGTVVGNSFGSQPSMGGSISGSSAAPPQPYKEMSSRQPQETKYQPPPPPTTTSKSFKPLPFQQMSQADFRQPFQGEEQQEPIDRGRPPSFKEEEQEGGKRFSGRDGRGPPPPGFNDPLYQSSPFEVPPFMMMGPPPGPGFDRPSPPPAESRSKRTENDSSVKVPKDPFAERQKKQQRSSSASNNDNRRPSNEVKVPKDPFLERQTKHKELLQQQDLQRRQRKNEREMFEESLRNRPTDPFLARQQQPPSAQGRQPNEPRKVQPEMQSSRVMPNSNTDENKPKDPFVERQRKGNSSNDFLSSLTQSEVRHSNSSGNRVDDDDVRTPKNSPYSEQNNQKPNNKSRLSPQHSAPPSSSNININNGRVEDDGFNGNNINTNESSRSSSIRDDRNSLGSTSFGKDMTYEEYSSYFGDTPK